MKSRALLIFAVLALTVVRVFPSYATEGGTHERDPKNLWVYKESLSLGVPEAELTKLVDDCKAKGFTTVEIQRMLGLIARAKLAGLPHRALLFKLQEGLAKNASPELIDAALAQKAQSLKKAKGIADNLIIEGFSAKDYDLAVQVVADVLDAGVSPQAIMGLIRDGGAPPQGLPDPAKLFIPFDAKSR